MSITHIPVEQGLPKLGNEVKYILSPFTLLHTYQRKYKDIVEIKLRNRSIYLLTNPTLVEEVLESKNQFFRQDSVLREQLAAIFGNGIGASDRDERLTHQPIMQPTFHQEQLTAYAELVVQFTQHVLRTIPNKTYFDIHQMMLNITLNIIGQALFSVSTPQHIDIISQSVYTITQRYNTNNWFTILEQVSGIVLNKKLNAAHKSAIADFDAAVHAIISERLQYTEQPNDLLGMLIKSHDEAGKPVSLAQLCAECKTIFLAGYETTALNLSWTMWLVHSNPAIALRLHVEIAQVLNGRPPRLEDVPSLIYTGKVIRESLRIKPSVWLTQCESLTDIEIGEYRIPARKTVAMSPLAIHNDPRWYPNPEQFNPDRWSDEFTQKLPRFAYFPFSGDPRLCIGQHFALVEATIILVLFMQRGNWQIDPRHAIKTQPSITMHPQNGIRMLVKYP